VIIQVLAIPVHWRRGEKEALPVNIVLGLLAAFVAAARFRLALSGHGRNVC